MYNKHDFDFSPHQCKNRSILSYSVLYSYFVFRMFSHKWVFPIVDWVKYIHVRIGQQRGLFCMGITITIMLLHW